MWNLLIIAMAQKLSADESKLFPFENAIHSSSISLTSFALQYMHDRSMQNQESKYTSRLKSHELGNDYTLLNANKLKRSSNVW